MSNNSKPQRISKKDKKSNGDPLQNRLDVDENLSYSTNEQIFHGFRELLTWIRRLNLNMDICSIARRTSINRLRYFQNDSSQNRDSKKARSMLDACEKSLRTALENTRHNAVQPPFYVFCQKMELDFYEQIILFLVMVDDPETINYHNRMVTVHDILDVLCKGYLPVEKVKRYLRSDGHLRTKYIFRLVGTRPIISFCTICPNLDFMEQIYHEDYDQTIETQRMPWEEGENTENVGITEDEIKETWDSLILPAETKEMIRNGIIQVKYSDVFINKMGYGKKIHIGRGISMLFSGPPGTGKTMAARVVAAELGQKLMIVSYSKLENMYCGGTEKNIDRCFADAKKKNAVLLFDEADAVFYSRNSNEKSWANRDVSVLLQAIEKFDGVVILTTNSGKLLDMALERRMSIKITFPIPDARARENIYRVMAPEALETGVDFHNLAERYEFSGGQIKNVLLSAGRLALKRTDGASDTKVSLADLEMAAKLEESGKESMQTSLGDDKPKGYA